MKKLIIILTLILLIVLSGCKEIVNVYHTDKECCVPVNDSYIRCCGYQCGDLECEDDYYFEEYLKCCNDILDEVCK